jgi:hypothetical protein
MVVCLATPGVLTRLTALILAHPAAADVSAGAEEIRLVASIPGAAERCSVLTLHSLQRTDSGRVISRGACLPLD